MSGMMQVVNVVCKSCRGAKVVAGGHTSGQGFEDDLEKLNEAHALGWKVYRFTPGMIKRGEAIKFLIQHVPRAAGGEPMKKDE